MEALFLTVLELSLRGSILILAILPVRALLKRAPRWSICLLWMLAAIALICPVHFESPASVMPADTVITAWTETVTAPALPNVQTEPVMIPDLPVHNGTPTPTSAAHSLSLLEIGSLVWVGGMGIMTLYALWSLVQLSRRVKISIPAGENVYLCDSIDTPFILGILRPRIYLPSTLDSSLHEAVLLHERAHLKRRDHWWKPLGYLLLTIHWFAPPVWLGYVLLCRDIELACDEKVIRTMSTQQKKHYSEALLRCSMPRHLIAACPLAFGEVSAKQRIKAILHYQKPAFWMVLIAIAVCVGLCFGFLTDPISKNEEISLDELRSFLAGSEQNLWKITIDNGMEYEFVTEHDISRMWQDVLSSLTLSDEAVQTDVRPKYNLVTLETADHEEIILHFSKDWSQVWAIHNNRSSAVYTILNPETLQKDSFPRGFFWADEAISEAVKQFFSVYLGDAQNLRFHCQYMEAYGIFAIVSFDLPDSANKLCIVQLAAENGTLTVQGMEEGTWSTESGFHPNYTLFQDNAVIWSSGSGLSENRFRIDFAESKGYTYPLRKEAFVYILPAGQTPESLTVIDENDAPKATYNQKYFPAVGSTTEIFRTGPYNGDTNLLISSDLQPLIEEHLRSKNRHFANLEMLPIVHHDARSGMTYAMFSMDILTHDGTVTAENRLHLAGFTNGRIDGIVSGEWAMSAGYYPNVADFNGNLILWSTYSDTHMAVNDDGTVNPNATQPNEYTSYHLVYDDASCVWWHTDRTPLMYLPLDQGRSLVKIAPVDERGFDVEAFAFTEEYLTPVNVNTISEVSGWDVFLEMNAQTGNIEIATSLPLYSEIPLYIDMDSSFTGNEALYAALKESEHFSNGWPVDLKLMGQQSYGDYEYAVLQFAQVHGPTAALVEYTIDGSAVTIHSYGEGYAPDTQGFLTGYLMNCTFMEGGTMYWSLYAPRYATTKDGKDIVDNNGLTPETVESKFTGFQFTMRDLKPYVFPAAESFFLCEFTTVIPPAIVTPMEGRTLLAALGSECP